MHKIKEMARKMSKRELMNTEKARHSNNLLDLKQKMENKLRAKPKPRDAGKDTYGIK